MLSLSLDIGRDDGALLASGDGIKGTLSGGGVWEMTEQSMFNTFELHQDRRVSDPLKQLAGPTFPKIVGRQLENSLSKVKATVSNR